MDNQPVSAEQTQPAVPSFAELVGETPGVDASPQQDQQAAPQIDWDAEKTRWEQTLAEKQAEIQRVASERDQIAQAAQHFVAQDLAQKRAVAQSALDRQLEEGEITAVQYRAAIQRERDEERTQMEQQVRQALLPVWTQEYAASKGLTAEETGRLKGVPMEAVEWTVQDMLASRERDKALRDEIEQLRRSVQAQGVVQQGVTRTVTGGGGGGPEQFEPGSLGHMRSALSALGHADMLQQS